jgi:hypothetical protein
MNGLDKLVSMGRWFPVYGLDGHGGNLVDNPSADAPSIH